MNVIAPAAAFKSFHGPQVGGTDSSVDMERPYYPALDGLRALAFFMVFFFHFMGVPWGGTGVEIFFVLSGFLITGILYDTRDKPNSLRTFYIRRTLRIFPLYYAVLLFAFLFGLAVHAKSSPAWVAYPLYLGNLTGFLHPSDPSSAFSAVVGGNIDSPAHPWLALRIGHLWSLCVEEQFYLVWPAIVLLLKSRRRMVWFCLTVIVICPAGRLLAQTYAPQWLLDNQFLYRGTPFRVDAFMYGALLALLRRGGSTARLQKLAGWVMPAALALLAVMLGPHLLDGAFKHVYVYPSWSSTWGLLLADLFSFFVLVLALVPGSFVYRVLTPRPMRWVGRISYGAYVFHYLFLTQYSRVLDALGVKHKLLPTIMISLPLTLGLAYLSFRFFETPFIRLKKHWES